MAIYRRGKIYWARWVKDGELHRESLGTKNRRQAEERFKSLISGGRFEAPIVNEPAGHPVDVKEVVTGGNALGPRDPGDKQSDERSLHDPPHHVVLSALIRHHLGHRRL